MITFPFQLWSFLSAQWHHSWWSWEKTHPSPAHSLVWAVGLKPWGQGSRGSGAPRSPSWLTVGWIHAKKKSCLPGGLARSLAGRQTLCCKMNVMGIQVSEFPYEKRNFPFLSYLIYDVHTLFVGREQEKYILKGKQLDATLLILGIRMKCLVCSKLCQETWQILKKLFSSFLSFSTIYFWTGAFLFLPDVHSCILAHRHNCIQDYLLKK